MAKIVIVTSGHFSTNPRVWREADALAKAGHRVVVVGVSYDPRQAEMDQEMMRTRSWTYRAAADLRSRRWPSRIHRQFSRLRTRCGRFLLSRGWPDGHAFGYAVGSLLDASLDEKADLTILHLQPALWVGTKLKRAGLAIGVDIEDWYSENGSGEPQSREVQYLRFLERAVLKMAVHATTMSQGMAAALSSAYEVPIPEVIYNGIPVVAACTPVSPDGPLRLLWFSQTIGPGRGLDDLCAALPQLTGSWRLEIRGQATPEARAWLEAQIPAASRGQVRIETFVPPDLLNAVVSENDVGLALDFPSCRNKDLTISNKMLQYLQTGLQVVAATTEGAREAQSILPQAVHLYPAGRVSDLSDLINRLIRNRSALVTTRERIHQAANERFGYERQSPRLLASIDRAFRVRGGS